MKQHFPGFYAYTKQELKDLIGKSTIAGERGDGYLFHRKTKSVIINS